MHTSMYMYIPTCSYIHTYIHIHIWTCILTCSCIHTYIHNYMYIHIHIICMHIYMHIYIYMYTYIHSCIYLYFTSQEQTISKKNFWDRTTEYWRWTETIFTRRRSEEFDELPPKWKKTYFTFNESHWTENAEKVNMIYLTYLSAKMSIYFFIDGVNCDNTSNNNGEKNPFPTVVGSGRSWLSLCPSGLDNRTMTLASQSCGFSSHMWILHLFSYSFN